MKANLKKIEALPPQKPIFPEKRGIFSLPYYVKNDDDKLIYQYKIDKSQKFLIKIIENYNFFIKKSVNRFHNYTRLSNNIEIDDLYSEGKIAFINALNAFDQEKGFKLATIAKKYLHMHLCEYVLENVYKVKISKSTLFKKLFFKLNHLKKINNLSNEILDDQDILKISNLLNSSFKQTKIIINFIQNKNIEYNEDENNEDKNDNKEVNSINTIYNTSSELFNKNVENIIHNNLTKFRQKQSIKALEELNKINSRQRDIIELRFKKNESIKTLAKKYNLSAQRISSIEKQGLANLRKIFTKLQIEAVDFF